MLDGAHVQNELAQLFFVLQIDKFEFLAKGDFIVAQSRFVWFHKTVRGHNGLDQILCFYNRTKGILCLHHTFESEGYVLMFTQLLGIITIHFANTHVDLVIVLFRVVAVFCYCANKLFAYGVFEVGKLADMDKRGRVSQADDESETFDGAYGNFISSSLLHRLRIGKWFLPAEAIFTLFIFRKDLRFEGVAYR